MMSELLDILTNAVVKQSREDKVSLLLSGGIDALTVGLALQAAGKTIHAYTYRLDRFPSRDLKKAIALAANFGWKLTVITVPVAELPLDFIRLAVEHGCRRKVQFEVIWPMLYILPAVEETEVWTGWNADEHYGNDRETVLQQAALTRAGVHAAARKQAFDERRRNFFEKEFFDPKSDDTFCYARRLTEKNGKRLLDPYVDRAVAEYFRQFEHAQLSRPTKPLVRQAFSSDFEGLPPGVIASGVQMHSGAGVAGAFLELLGVPTINRFQTMYSSVSALCRRWGREVAKDEMAFAKELFALPPAPRAHSYECKPRRLEPYTNASVRLAAERRRFKAVCLFAGGGGTSAGISLAGGHVLLANEFVREAAHTYRANFPNTLVDDRDIRLITSTEPDILSFLAQAGLSPDELDLLCADPPCSESSPGRRRRDDNGESRPYSDTAQRNIGLLIFDAIEVAKVARPKVVLMENVPELRTRRGDLFAAAMGALRSSGAPGRRLYFAEAAVLSSADFGVAQNRERLFILGIRCDVALRLGINKDQDVLSIFPPPLHPPISIRTALAGLKQSQADLDPWRRAMMVHRIGRIVAQLPRNPPKLVRPVHVGLPAGSWFTLARCSLNLPAPTLTVSGQRPGGLSGAIHPLEDRKFSLPELKRLTGLPDDFVLTGTLSQAAERICRMVTPPLMKAIAENIYENILQPYRVKACDC